MSHVQITGNGTTAAVEVDGQDLAKYCAGATLKLQSGDITRLTLDMVIAKTAEYEGEAVVRLDSDTVQVLTALGWTPPPEPVTE